MSHVAKSIFGLLLFLAHTLSHSASIQGAGSSAAKPLYEKWAEAYQQNSGVDIGYQPVGSSAGIKKIKEQAVDFGASDVALTPQDLQASHLIQFPSAISGVVPVVNLTGVRSGELKLTGELLAAIFTRKITRWNDPAIAAQNPAANLPKSAITVIARADGSGTTYNFSDYLSRINAQWKISYGVNFLVKWPAEVILAKGSAGVVAALKQTPNAITYVDYNYVIQDRLTYAQLKNAAGVFVSPKPASFESALNHSSWKTQATFNEMLTDKAGTDSWPITMGTFVILPKVATDVDQTIAVLKYFSWCFMQGDHYVNSLDFVRLPDAIQAKVFKQMTSVVNDQGKHLNWSPM